MHSVPTLIVGGGLAGASLACSLAEREAGRGVTIADVDLFGKYGSSESSAGDVHVVPDGVAGSAALLKLSIASARYYLENAFRLDFRPRGYVRTYGAGGHEAASAVREALRSVALPAEELTPAALRERFPLIGPAADLSDVDGALLTPADGRLSPHRLRLNYLNRAQACGVEIMDRWQVVRVAGDRTPFEVTLRQVSGRGVKKALMDEAVTAPRGGGTAAPGAAELTVRVDRLVNAAGPWAPRVARLYGVELPVTPVPRHAFLLRCDGVDLEPLPAFADGPQAIEFGHHEWDRKACVRVSWDDPATPRRVDFTPRDAAWFDANVRPRLARRLPGLAAAPLVGGWVGHDDPSADDRPVIGPVAGRPGLFNYNGLSGRAVIYSRGLGEAMAIRLVHDRWPIGLDLDELTDARFRRGPR